MSGTGFVEALREQVQSHGGYRAVAQLLAEEGLARSKDTVALWCQGKQRMWPDEVFAIERVLDQRPGTLSRLLGYLPLDAVPALTPEAAIETDGSLRGETRDALLDILRGVRARNSKHRAR